MPDRTWIIVFFPTPLIFRYHLPFKGTQAWDNFLFFLPKSNPNMPFVNFRKKFRFIFLRFSPEFRCLNISAVTEHTLNGWTKFFLRDVQKKFFLHLHFGPILWVPKRFFKILIFFIGKICILIRDFWVIFEIYSMRMLSIRGNDFIAHWAYEETISSHTEHTRNEFSRKLSQRWNMNSFYM